MKKQVECLSKSPNPKIREIAEAAKRADEAIKAAEAAQAFILRLLCTIGRSEKKEGGQ